MYKRLRKSALHEAVDLMGRLNSGGPRILTPSPPQNFLRRPAPLPVLKNHYYAREASPKRETFVEEWDEKYPATNDLLSIFFLVTWCFHLFLTSGAPSSVLRAPSVGRHPATAPLILDRHCAWRLLGGAESYRKRTDVNACSNWWWGKIDKKSIPGYLRGTFLLFSRKSKISGGYAVNDTIFQMSNVHFENN